MSTITLREGDVIEQLKLLEDNSIDSIITDPPYNLSFMGKKWDNKGAPKEFQQWCAEWGQECLRVLRNGGYILVFGGTRTFHRVTSGLEDAGFTIKDCLSWNYGTGFPKSHNISKAIDKLGGDPKFLKHMAHSLKSARKSRNMSISECDKLFCDSSTNWSWLEGRRESINIPTLEQQKRIVKEWPELEPIFSNFNKKGELKGQKKHSRSGGEDWAKKVGSQSQATVEQLYDNATPASELWDGYGTGLKPAWEPIILAQKPFKGTYASNVLNQGVGALNIDSCRITVTDVTTYENNRRGFHERMKNDSARPYEGGWKPNTVEVEENKGRWPANAIFQHHPDCQVVGNAKIKGSIRKPTGKPLFDDTGNADRSVQWNANNVKDTTVRGHGDEIVPVWECHADCPAHILDNQSGVSKSSDAVRRNKREDKKLTMGGKIHAKGGSETHGFKDKGGASRFFYCPKTAKKEKTCNGLVENTHPTVKPIGLIEWVLKLSTPQGQAMGRNPVVLDCFLGSGTTAVAAHRQNIDCIGIDNNADYLDIAEQRLQNDWRLTEDAISPIIKRV
jgi:DNA modification methylase